MIQPSVPTDLKASYSLEELVACAGERLGDEITTRTIRLYATQGLIDRPQKDGRRALYRQRQLLQLLVIRVLAQRGLSLAAIAPLVAATDEELQEQLQQLEEASLPPSVVGAASIQALQPLASPSNDALDYLRDLGGGEAPRATPSERALRSARSSRSAASEPQDTSDSLLQLWASPASSGSSGTPVPPGRQLSRGISSRSSRASRWHRFSLAPGVELHLSDAAPIPPSGKRREVWLQRLLERLMQQLDQHS